MSRIPDIDAFEERAAIAEYDGGTISRRQGCEEEAVCINGAFLPARVVNPERGSPLAAIEGRI